ncbi:MAG: PAS domain-containing protein [Clostridia bacterium]|nr:PAS domain-containing protein [Clostridia bacterium]
MTFVYWVLLIAFLLAVLYLIRSSLIETTDQFILTKASEKISDGYLIFATNGKITNYNEAVLDALGFAEKNVKDKNIYELLQKNTFDTEDTNKIINACQKIKNSNETIKFEIKNKKDNRIFKIEIKSIVNNDIFLRYVLICKDVTSAYEIIEELQSNQDMMANREKFATLGQLISRNCPFLEVTNFCFVWGIGGLKQFDKRISRIGWR